jgi:RimJ/RimL family protein N-acetyltransferase
MLIFLETERLVLRQFNPHDADLLVELDGDPRVMRYITGGAATPREEIESEYLPAFLGYYPKYPGYGFWATGCAARRGGRATPPRVPVR